MRGTKLNTHVDFPITNLRLDQIADVMSDSHEGRISKKKITNIFYYYIGPMPTYNLFGISNHSGTVYSGHYIAQCKHPYTQEWHEFNDSSVHLISDNSRIISADAYVLFYERK
jgi:ubiquitin C-terminal hydrolase